LLLSERSRRCTIEAPNRRRINAVGARNVCLSFAVAKPLNRFSALMRPELRRSSEIHSPGHGTLTALAGLGPNQLAFKLSQAAPGCWRWLALPPMPGWSLKIDCC
jgi:hypothetical protein